MENLKAECLSCLHFRRVAFILAGALAMLAACASPATDPAGGSLSITVGNNINAKTLLPGISMNAASYTVSGTGPGSVTFSMSTAAGTVTIDGLAFGNWSVTVYALNSAGAKIGSGQAAATVHVGGTTAVAISVVPLPGNGTLSLTVGWTATQVETPSIQASLTPASGSALPLSFSVAGNQATFASSAIPAGYHTLSLQILDNGTAVAGAVEIVRIVAEQTTSGSYSFTNVNQPGGSLQVSIAPALADPIPVSISGVSPTVVAGTSVTATASASGVTGNLVYVWYLNGLSKATGPSFTFGSSLAAGYYRLDVMAYSSDGTRAGSATASFQVTAPVVAKAWSWIDRSAAGSRQWKAITSSSDGTHLAACITNNGDIWTSSDSGLTWIDRSAAGTRIWNGIASSADGTHLAACATGDIWTSTDSGLTWTDRSAAGRRGWNGIASSSDGTHLTACVNSGDIWTSSDSGLTWTDRSAAGSRAWYGIASSSDGTHLAASVYLGDIWTSSDSGVTWIDRSAAGSRGWTDIASSSDGTHLAACSSDSYAGDIWTSSDSGATWTKRSAAGSRDWRCIASSSDGMFLAAGTAVSGGLIWTSADSGLTWNYSAPDGVGTKMWIGIASSSDGTRLAACGIADTVSGDIWTGAYQ
jgi:hypothetical protein